MQDLNLQDKLAQQIAQMTADLAAKVEADRQARAAQRAAECAELESLNALQGYLSAVVDQDLDLGVPTVAALPFIENHSDPVEAIADLVSRSLTHALNGLDFSGTGVYYMAGSSYGDIPSLSEGIAQQLGLPDGKRLNPKITAKALMAIATAPPDADPAHRYNLVKRAIKAAMAAPSLALPELQLKHQAVLIKAGLADF